MVNLWIPAVPPRIDAEWMDRRQSVLVPLANTPEGRRLFRFPSEVDGREVTYLGPTGVIYRYPEGGPHTYQGVFSSGRPRYAQRAHRFLGTAAREGWLAAVLKWGGSRSLEMRELAAAIASPATFNPDANPETTSVDGTVERDVTTEAWTTIRSGAGTAAADASATATVALYTSAIANTYILLGRAVLLFDTSALTSGALVTAATLSVYGSGKSDTLGQSATIVRCSPASNIRLVAADYNIANWTMTQQNTTDMTSINWSTSGYNDFALNLLTGVNIVGISKYGLVMLRDRTNTPTWSAGINDYFQFQTSEGANKPKLVVTFTVGTHSVVTMPNPSVVVRMQTHAFVTMPDTSATTRISS